MKKFLFFIVALVVILGIYFVSIYNSIPIADEVVEEKFSQVQNQYKRRADLIPSLVKVVEAYAKHEKATLKAVIEARAKATSVNIASTSDAKQMQEFMGAQQGLSSALSRLMVSVERYPDLKANQNFLSLQSQLEGTENRISVARRDYIKAVKDYNLVLRKLPTSIVAKNFFPELKTRQTFEISKEEQKVPEVSFDIK